MAHLIDKDALVAEIDRRLEELYKLLPDASKVENGTITISEACNTGKYTALESFENYIDSLEVKEVDLEKELDSMITPELKLHKALPSLFDVAKHFFELGLCNTITEEDCKLIWNIGDEIPNMLEEEFFKELLRRYKAQKGE
jgi:uncharacterized protein YbaR (Trm112 family)